MGLSTMNLCSVNGCGRPTYAHSLCTMHYKRLKRNGHVDRLSSLPKEPLPERSCACGCGERFIPKRHSPSRPQVFIKGHWSRLLRKESVRTITQKRREAFYEAAGHQCQQCGLSMADQVERYGRRLEIHHENHDHHDNTDGNHKVLCTGCHNQESLAVRDEVKKSRTWRERYAAGLITMWADGLTKETDSRVAAMAAKKTRPTIQFLGMEP